ncbi:mannan endo-1,6-alpha-mannosidase DCW1 [Rhypophila decipiens]|uniref:mannan endo-1,6-alpha-mannosidase n=1 Tax=Rhypophila decipiens TaxID=261697 RepID=A0AAN6Y202_9PEZI|nr:mannan endo-1,6-alpha-mannosidase DCW1 [Rhypophila decipiens]
MHGWWTTRGAGFAWCLLMVTRLSPAYQFDAASHDSIKSVASSLAQDLMGLYDVDRPGAVPGLLPEPYYWWEAGALMGAMVDYWAYTGDTQWVNLTKEGLLFQTGPNNDYMPPNQTMTEGNDDQGFWALAAMSAAEYNFQNPPSDKPQWLALAQAVFNTQAARWETQECGGGLRWQIFTWNNGYDYKNTISQACFFNLAARLALYTGNQSYADWADKTWDWMESTDLLDPETYYVYDGVLASNCSNITPYQWTYNAGAFLLGASAMYNYTSGKTRQVWRTRLDGLLNGTMIFFQGNNSDIMSEVACEPVDLCDVDQQSFKAYLSRWMAAAIKWAPWTSGRILPLLRSTSIAAVSTCKGGPNGRMCGLKWTTPGSYDGFSGVGQQMAVMQVVLSNLIPSSADPLTTQTGGTSVGDPAAGGQDISRLDPFTTLDFLAPVTTSARAGAAVITALMILFLIGGCLFMLVDEKSEKTLWQMFLGLDTTTKPGGWRDTDDTDQIKSSDTPGSLGREPLIGSPNIPLTTLTNRTGDNMVIKVHHTTTLSSDQAISPTQTMSRQLSWKHVERRNPQIIVSKYWDGTSYHDEQRTARPSGSRQRLSKKRPEMLRD